VNPKIPDRIAALPKDSRGYPIPWNVLTGNDGKPIFTVNDSERHLMALRLQLCPICGGRLGKWRWFVGGILSAFALNGGYYDLPGHHECESFALSVCPYLSAPKYLGRIDVPDVNKVPEDVMLANITMMPERPDVFCAVASDSMEILQADLATITIRPKRPYLGIEYWIHGKQVSLEEALPLLRKRLGSEAWLPPALRVL
jgi:hypothetical protein